MKLVAIAARGTEAVLAEELSEMGLGPIEERRGALALEGSLADAYRAVMWSRVASRVLLVIAEAMPADGADALYESVRSIDWTDHLDERRTIAVDLARSGPTADNPRFLTMRVKDAIVDRVRDARGSRPSVDTRRPDVRVHVHLAGGRATVSIDLAGSSLHKRGRGATATAAPLKESLAAALLRIAGYPRLVADGIPLVDPMCGSGTICAEAAAIALDLAPGLSRARHGFDGWLGHEPDAWAALVREASARREATRDRRAAIHGWDASEAALSAAREKLERLGVAHTVTLERRALVDASAPPAPEHAHPRGLVVTNPPYGARLGEAGELGPLYEQLGDVLRTRFAGFHAFVLSGNRALDKRIGLRATRRHVVYNGPIECRFLELPIAETPVREASGPSWRKPSDEAQMLANRLRKNLRRLRPWATREGISCYCVYDADVAEYNVAIDRYEDAAVVQEYERPRWIDPEVADRHLRDAMLVVPGVLGIDPANVTIRVRRRGLQKGHAPTQHEELREVGEGGLRFLVSLTDYLDTGLFLDHRRMRAMIRDLAAGRAFLNLFAYTCTATVYAAAGGARSTTSVDLSRTYLDWGARNLAKNGHSSGRAHELVRADCLEWLEHARGRYDLIFCAPPTWSRSKAMRGDFDVQRDHVALLRRCARLLSPGGVLLFSTPLRTFALEAAALPDLRIEDITQETVPFDFARSPRAHRAFRVRPT